MTEKVEWALLIDDHYLKLILDKRKTWDIRTTKLFEIGERIALGNTKSKLIEGYATISDIKKLTLQEMKNNNDKHLANDFIDRKFRKKNAPHYLYALILTDVLPCYEGVAYPRSFGNPKIKLYF